MTIHDLIFLHTPQYYHWIDRKIYQYKFRKACQNADRIIAVSEYTKQEIIDYFHTPKEKIDVVYQGCDPVFSQEIAQEKLEEVREKYSLPEEFVLYVGSIEERKNLLLLAKAIALLAKGECRAECLAENQRKKEIQVVAVGRHTPYVEEIQSFLKEQGIEHLFHFYHKVPYEDLPSFYKLAQIFVYPSRIEGFGIPLLEAISSGVPAIGCTGSCLEEAGGPDSIYVAPDDAQSMAATLLNVSSDALLRQNMIMRGRKYAKRFTDEKLFHSLYETYQKI